MWNWLGGDRVALLAFHLALVDRPWSPVVVSTVALASSFATGLEKALVYLKKSCENVDNSGKYLWRDQLRYALSNFQRCIEIFVSSEPAPKSGICENTTQHSRARVNTKVGSNYTFLL